MRNWQDDPRYRDFADWIDDNSPHLNGYSMSDPELVAELRSFEKGRAAAGRSAGAAKAAKTRACNAAAGISQKDLVGTLKQKQWAAKIRGEAIARCGADLKEFFDGRDTHASFWIENRNSGDWANIMREGDKLWQAYLEAKKAMNALPVWQGPEFSDLNAKLKETIAAYRVFFRLS